MDSGEWLGERYRLEQRIDSGRGTEVWRAWDRVLARPVALKLVPGEPLLDPASRTRVRDGILACAALSHHGIVTVYDSDETSGAKAAPVPYLVMELIDGVSLADGIRGGPLPVATAIQVCTQVAEALSKVHGAGLVHGDIRPSKVLLTPDGVRVLAPSLTREPAWDALPYLPPEQPTTAPPTRPADIYALGILLTECLTGKRSPTTPLPDTVPPAATALCHRCRSTAPEARPTAPRAATTLRAVSGPPAPPPATPPP
ncbi:serine/threonine-protein kinase, partial [Actinocorallia longicatena]|uniref:serine/threonine-protein kinase n=1 Tax=Actinocorallia longicatena TaxID=111803 RepID=UPI0031DCCE8E